MLVDSHCHLNKEFFDNIDKLREDAFKSRVGMYISAADSLSSCYEMLELASLYEDIYIALGIHPEHCNDDYDEYENILISNLNNKKLVAIGEIGLDYYYGKDNKEQQIKIFERQLALAEKYNMPVVVHSRDATLDTIECLKKYKVKGVIHCFSGSLQTALEYIKMGFYIGVGGVMTFKKANIKEVIKEIPLDRILLETDSPFLTPEPYRKYRNEPKYIRIIAEYLANIMNIDIAEVSKVTRKNVKDVFDI